MAATRECTRFAFATNEYERGVRQIRHGLEVLRVNEETEITVLSDGDAGLRTVQWEVAPKSEHVLDWFHIGMRFEHFFDACQAIRHAPMAAHVAAWAHQLATRAKWAAAEWPSGQNAMPPGSGARLDRIGEGPDTRNSQIGTVCKRPPTLSACQPRLAAELWGASR